MILSWPGGPTPVPGSHRLPRTQLDPADLAMDSHGYDILTGQALERITGEIEAAHAEGIFPALWRAVVEDDGKGVLGVYIHNLESLAGQQSLRGSNPFAGHRIKASGASLATIVKAYEPMNQYLD
jgi:hypothetical protein